VKVTCDYDNHADVLYISFNKPTPAICEEMMIPVLVRYKQKIGKVVGITILNLKDIKPKRFNEHK